MNIGDKVKIVRASWWLGDLLGKTGTICRQLSSGQYGVTPDHLPFEDYYFEASELEKQPLRGAAYWDLMKKTAAKVSRWPDWKKGS